MSFLICFTISMIISGGAFLYLWSFVEKLSKENAKRLGFKPDIMFPNWLGFEVWSEDMMKHPNKIRKWKIEYNKIKKGHHFNRTITICICIMLLGLFLAIPCFTILHDVCIVNPLC